MPADGEDRPVRRDRRDRRAAAVEDDEVGPELERDLRRPRRRSMRTPLRRGPRRTAGSRPSRRRRAPPSRGGPRLRAGPPGTARRGLDGGRHADDLRLRGPAAAHGDDDDAPRLGHEPREVPGEGRLPHALPGADDRDRRERERLEPRRVEAEVGARVRHARRSTRLASARRSTGPRTGSSERSTTISGR